jgi:hypothetical protein
MRNQRPSRAHAFAGKLGFKNAAKFRSVWIAVFIDGEL